MELDTGTTVSLVSVKTFHQLFPGTELQPATIQLHSYSGESISVKGQVEVEVRYGEQTALVVVNGEGPSLFGRDWMTEIKLDWKKICTVTNTMSLTKLLDCHSSLFEPGLKTTKLRFKLTHMLTKVDPHAN